mmetsp:Transcript_19788/g.27622  ORF Transcript_19788/g.27622 Transcript_19788/m.27622 type:complete len:396 (+) Transcript_19788:84-1271(+)
MNAKAQQINFINFNQDYTCLSVGLSDGFRVFSTQPKFSEVYSQNLNGVGICEMLFCSSLVAVVGSGDDATMTPRKLHMMNTKNQTTLCELSFVTPIIAVRLNKKRLVVVMETKIHIYDISNMKILHTIDTLPNPKGICALSPSESNCYLAYPGSTDKGDIIIFDALTLQTVSIIHAHKTPLAKLAINESGTLIASASTKGTVIRVCGIPESSRFLQLRRGSYPANVNCISFSSDSSYLCVSSDTGTVHVFKLDQSQSPSYGYTYGFGNLANNSSGGSQDSSGGNGHVGLGTSPPKYPKNEETTTNASIGANTGVSAFLPEVLSDMWDTIPVRSFASCKLAPSVPSLCALNHHNTILMIASSDGVFHQFGLDQKGGGEMKLISEHKFFQPKFDEAL